MDVNAEAGGVGRPLDRLINAGSLQSKQSGAGLGERTPHWAVQGDLRRALKGGFKGAFRGPLGGLRAAFPAGLEGGLKGASKGL